VDAHPICAVCGAAVAPVPAGRWVHVPAGRPFGRPSRWFGPVRWRVVRSLATYRAFTERYPWTVRPELCGGTITSEADWRDGVGRLRDYHAALTAARRRRVLGADENLYLDLVRLLADRGGAGLSWAGLVWAVPGGVASVLDLAGRRRELAALFAWAIPDQGALAVLARYAPLVECGAGTGYWAALLQASGVDVVAADLTPPGGPGNQYHDTGHRPWAPVRQASAIEAVRASPGRALFLCWPPYDDDGASYAALRAYRGDVLIYVGGGADGPTGTVRFHRELALNWHPVEQAPLPNWPGLRDRLVVYRRNPARRPLTARDRCAECRRFLPTGTAGRCDQCFAGRPPAMALRVNGHRVEYPREVVAGMPVGLRLAFERSSALIHPPRAGAASPSEPTGLGHLLRGADGKDPLQHGSVAADVQPAVDGLGGGELAGDQGEDQMRGAGQDEIRRLGGAEPGGDQAA
jgi:hypothetical protein